MTLQVLGIRACDRCRDALRWLADHEIEFEWRDLREVPPNRTEVATWLRQAGEQQMVNRRSTSWRNLSDDERPAAGKAVSASLLVKHPLLIRRPLWIRASEVRCSFDDSIRDWLGEP